MFKIQYEWIQNLTFRNPLMRWLWWWTTNPPTELRSNYCITQVSKPIMAHMLTLPRDTGTIFLLPQLLRLHFQQAEGLRWKQFWERRFWCPGPRFPRRGRRLPRGNPEFTNMKIAGKWPWPKLTNGHIWNNVNVYFYCDSFRFFCFSGLSPYCHWTIQVYIYLNEWLIFMVD